MSSRNGRWELDPTAVLSHAETRKLRTASRTAASRGGPAVRDWFLIDMAMSSGLRVSELAALERQDIVLDGVPAVIVRKGKGGKRRVVLLDPAVAKHARSFIAWKRRNREPDSPIFWSRQTGKALTPRALQKAFSRSMARAGMLRRFGIHGLRHTYATHLYQASGHNLRFVQKQLGHARIDTTQVYADVLAEDARKAVSRPLYGR